MIEGVSVDIDGEAVVVACDSPLRVLSSAVHRGGCEHARAIINLHVARHDPCVDPSGMLTAFADRRGIRGPHVGLLTGAWTEHATLGEESAWGMRAVAVTTVGLSNRCASGHDPVAIWMPDTINTIVVVDADPEPAALVNAVITATEVKVLTLGQAGVRGPDGGLVSGTSTDAVVIAATGRGITARFGGPASEMGWTIAAAVRRALAEGVSRWLARDT